MEAIPTVIAQAQKNLQHPPRVYTETAIEQTQARSASCAKVCAAARTSATNEKEVALLQEKTPGRSKIIKMAARWPAPALDAISASAGQVSQETALCPRLRLVDGRNHAARAGRFEANPDGHLRNRAAALQEIFPNAIRPRSMTERKLRRRCSTNWPRNIRTITRSSVTRRKLSVKPPISRRNTISSPFRKNRST